jgi:hypothetical protein
MRLANSETAISLDNETIHLRASLRAAFRLEQMYDGFQNLCEAIARCDLAASVDLIKAGTADPAAVDHYFNYLAANPMGEAVLAMREPLLQFVLLLSGADERSDGEPTGTPIPFGEYFTKLYRIATGWLGWTPEQAWNATPAEIIEAQRGRLEMLAAIFGSGKSQDETITDVKSVRDRLNALGDSTVLSMAEVP